VNPPRTIEPTARGRPPVIVWLSLHIDQHPGVVAAVDGIDRAPEAFGRSGRQASISPLLNARGAGVAHQAVGNPPPQRWWFGRSVCRPQGAAGSRFHQLGGFTTAPTTEFAALQGSSSAGLHPLRRCSRVLSGGFCTWRAWFPTDRRIRFSARPVNVSGSFCWLRAHQFAQAPFQFPLFKARRFLSAGGVS